VQITPNDIGTNSAQSSSLDAKIAQLINNLANKPLLIEKIALNQAQGILLKLVNNDIKLALQLPLAVTKSIEASLSNTTGILLSLTAKNQVKLELIPNSTNQKSIAATTLETLKTVIFQKALLQGNQLLKLDLPKQSQNSGSPPISRKTSSVQSQPVVANINNSNTSSAKPSTDNGQLVENANNVTNKGKINQTSDEATSKSLIGNAKSVKTGILNRILGINNPVSTNNPTDSIKAKNASTSNISVTDAVKTLLNRQPVESSPLSSQLTKLLSAAKSLESIISPSATSSKLFENVKRLTTILQKPNQQSAANIRQRVENSGNMLERKIGAQLKLLNPDNVALNSKSSKVELANISQNMATIKTSTTPSLRISDNKIAHPNGAIEKNAESIKINSDSAKAVASSDDLKLLLMKIRANLESIVRSSAKPSTKPTELSKPNASVASETARIQQPSTEAAQLIKQLQAGESDNKSTLTTPTSKNDLLLLKSLVFKQGNQLLTDVRNLISQIENNQLLSLRNEQANLHQFLVDLPFANGSKIESFELLFGRSNSQDLTKSKRHWKVVIRFDLEPLGPMFARVEMENERISTHLFSESSETAKLINDHLHILKQSLHEAGVDIDDLSGGQGNIPDKLLINHDRTIDTHV